MSKAAQKLQSAIDRMKQGTLRGDVLKSFAEPTTPPAPTTAIDKADRLQKALGPLLTEEEKARILGKPVRKDRTRGKLAGIGKKR